MSGGLPARKGVAIVIELFSTEQGGRTSGGIISGYRAIARFERSDRDYGFELTLDKPPLAVRARGTGSLQLWAPGAEPELDLGRRFEIRERAQVVGHGQITAPEPSDLAARKLQFVAERARTRRSRP